jgi:hypothetical protein
VRNSVSRTATAGNVISGIITELPDGMTRTIRFPAWE